MSGAGAERQDRAIGAAKKIAARYGVDPSHAVILQDSNHTIIHLVTGSIVAKVGTSPEETSAADEVRIARFLAARDAPVVAPTALFPPGPHVEDGLEVTFWEYCPHDSEEPTPEVLGQYLRILHDALSGYPDQLRAWDRFDGVDRILETPSALHALPSDDRAFLRRRYTELLAAMAAFCPLLRPLHGEPHSANLLLSPHGPRWIDFESACLGPREWDLTVLPDHVIARYFTAVDWDLLKVLRHMRSLVVAVWCWHDPDRAPVLREAGTYHLAWLKRGRGS